MRNKDRKKKMGRYILLVLVIGGVIAVFFGILTMSPNEGGSVTIESAKQLKINASEIGMGWEERVFVYTDRLKLVDSLKEFKIDEKQPFLEMATELEKCGIQDGYVLHLRKKTGEPFPDAAVICVFIFNDAEGARKFFDYMKNKRNGSSISGIGDEAAIYPRDGWLVRTSNAFIEVSFTRVEYEGKGEEGRIIAEKIVEKVSHK